ncbi:hypothetical protein THII_1668 [Thioploca ingrica]|uniref:Uncharacterized protein n=1 Tax=Thioploca ingrica TaxID=40754 RepID=A0A090ALH3_9GAMM|nr:hypothetical protein THII_1668 [Thioploca ingrica]
MRKPPLDQLQDLLKRVKQDCCLHPSDNAQIDSLFQEICQVANILLKRIESIINQGSIQQEQDYIKELLVILQNRLKQLQ